MHLTASARRAASAACGFALVVCSGCSPPKVDDALTTLRTPAVPTSSHERAMDMLDAGGDQPSEYYIDALHRMIWTPGYVVPSRRLAFDRLEATDEEGLKRTIRQQLPRIEAWAWLDELCERIAERGWTELTPALVSSWARPIMFVDKQREDERPEYEALVALHGEERVIDVVFDTFLEAKKPSEQGLRGRCWDLLHRLGQRPRLLALLQDAEAPSDDLMLEDLRAAASDFGMVPLNREEILWLRKLRQPEYASFWQEAKDAISRLEPERREALEVRDIPIAVAAARHQPGLLTAPLESLTADIAQHMKTQKHYSHGSSMAMPAKGSADRIEPWRDTLRWGDLAAMRLAIEAFKVPELRAHVFNYAERDRADETTEFGGVINLDDQGRFQILEFPPLVRKHDQTFVASQRMFDRAYTALFHFHLHVQKFDNDSYAGPGYGDLTYANNTGANCIVLTYVNRDTLNLDYYRHGGVVLDLGEVAK